MNIDNLNKIQRVEVPPFLFTKIEQRIAQYKSEKMPKNTALMVGFSFILLLIINTIILINDISKINKPENFIKSIHLISNNSLY